MNLPSWSSLILIVSAIGLVQGQNACGNCIPLDTVTITVIVICDIILTILIALTTYFIANKIQRKKEEGE
ncbi:hypothetical protein GDO86_019131 [Hymenochirus boettgeri]|uniref:DNAX-activation protein 10 n=1 Tax=Hymenochirus boettgeri TaxID=247094 RepID=A0A8T2IJG2_9PIPI|nr:hypothetical protein GDO86_019131 [Hymenochirus boettgeri]